MYSGQYTGTGTYGSDNHVSITFPFVTPRAVYLKYLEE